MKEKDSFESFSYFFEKKYSRTDFRMELVLRVSKFDANK